MVFCGTLDQDTQSPVTATGGSITITPTSQPFTYQCNWYNIPGGGENSVTVYKWDCEPGTEYGRELDYYQGGLPDQETGPCETEHLNVPISLIDGDGPHDTTTQANGTEWDGVVLDQNGSFQIAEEIPDGYGDPMVFCGTLDDETQTLVVAPGGTITITPASEPFTYQCNWYNLPGDTGITATTGQIVVEKYWCPEGLAFVQAPTRADMQAACQEPNPGSASFELTGPAGAEQTWPSQDATGGPPASVFWGDLPPGDYTITETGMGPGWTSMVFCHASSGEPNGAEEEQLTGPSIQRTLEGGFTIDCAWFNQPEGGNSVTVYKWDCVPGTEYGGTLEY
jgi:uncharacterized protein YodC (DUF2158 family)